MRPRLERGIAATTRRSESAVAKFSQPERLSDQQFVTLILRLLIDSRGDVVQGEVGGLAADQRTERWVRFRRVDCLLGAVQGWLVSYTKEGR